MSNKTMTSALALTKRGKFKEAMELIIPVTTNEVLTELADLMERHKVEFWVDAGIDSAEIVIEIGGKDTYTGTGVINCDDVRLLQVPGAFDKEV